MDTLSFEAFYQTTLTQSKKLFTHLQLLEQEHPHVLQCVQRLEQMVQDLSWRGLEAEQALHSNKDEYGQILSALLRQCGFLTSTWLEFATFLPVNAIPVTQIEQQTGTIWDAALSVINDYINWREQEQAGERDAPSIAQEVRVLMQTWATIAHCAVNSATTANALVDVFWGLSEEYDGLDAIEHRNYADAFSSYWRAAGQWNDAAAAFFAAKGEPGGLPLPAREYGRFALQCLYEIRRLWSQAKAILQQAYSLLQQTSQQQEREGLCRG